MGRATDATHQRLLQPRSSMFFYLHILECVFIVYNDESFNVQRRVVGFFLFLSLIDELYIYCSIIQIEILILREHSRDEW